MLELHRFIKTNVKFICSHLETTWLTLHTITREDERMHSVSDPNLQKLKSANTLGSVVQQDSIKVLCLVFTGVRSCGLEIRLLSLLSFIPLPRSKSQIFTGHICTPTE